VKLVDTSVWVGFFRGSASAAPLADALEADEVLLHPWVLGELVLGGLPGKQVMPDLRALPRAPVVADDEVVAMVEALRLGNSGIGWVDVQLIAASRTAHAELWTDDVRLARVVKRLASR
jgi:predicted nucleic acid-binding protein